MTERMSRCTRLSFDKSYCYDELVPAPRDRHIPDLVSASEAATMLGLTRQAIQLMANNGQLVGAKIGNAWVFRRSVVEKEAKERTKPPD